MQQAFLLLLRLCRLLCVGLLVATLWQQGEFKSSQSINGCEYSSSHSGEVAALGGGLLFSVLVFISVCGDAMCVLVAVDETAARLVALG